jgi:hypothetical protein
MATAETIRDVLGFVRLLYATRVAAGGDVDGLLPVGKELRVALDLAKYEEGSLGHRAAIDRAERALDALARQVEGGPLVDLVHRARQRLRDPEHPEATREDRRGPAATRNDHRVQDRR